MKRLLALLLLLAPSVAFGAADTITSSVCFQDPQGNCLANGLITFNLNVEAKVIAGGQVAPSQVNVTLDATGKIPAATVLYGNDQLQPSGTFYNVRMFNSNGLLVSGNLPLIWVISGASPVDLSLIVASSGSPDPGLSNPVLQNPAAGQTVTGQSLTLTASAPLIAQGNVTIGPGNLTVSGAATAASFNKTLYLDGTTYPQTCAGLASMITAGGSNSHLVIPPNVTLPCSASTLQISSLSNVLLEGSGDSSLITLTGSSSIIGIQAQGGGPGTSSLLNANAAEGATTVTLVSGGAASIGAAAGKYFQLVDTAAIVHEQIGRITSVAGDVVTIDEPIFATGGFTTANASAMSIVTLNSNIRIRNLKIDASANSGASTNGIQMNWCSNCEVSNITVTGTSGWSVESTGTHTSTFHDIFILASGSTGQAAFQPFEATHDVFNNIQIEHLPTNAFGFTFSWVNDSTASNLILNHTQSGGGRGFKTSTSSYNQWTNIIVESVATGFNGVSIEANSSHNRFTNVQALANAGLGIVTFGNTNIYNSFVNCTSKFNTSNQLVFNATDAHNSVIGGEFADARGAQALISISAADFQVIGAKIWDDNGQATSGGLAFGAGADKGVIIGNTFSGLGSQLDIVDSSSTNTTFAFNQVPDNVSRNVASNLWWQNPGDAKPSTIDRVGQIGSIFAESTAPNPTGTGTDTCYGDSTLHALKCAYNNGTFFQIPQVIASGTAAMPTSSVAAVSGTTITCVAAAGNPFTATGVLTTDPITFTPNASPSNPNGGLIIQAWPTAGGVNFEYCNPTASALTPVAETLNWKVIR